MKPWDLECSVLRIDGLLGASIDRFSRRSRIALHRCSDVLEDAFMLEPHDAADRGVAFSQATKFTKSDSCEVWCKECQAPSNLASAERGPFGGAWLCSMCWKQRSCSFSDGRLSCSARCTECGVAPALGGEGAAANLCRACSKDLRPRDLRWREASSVYWIRPQAEVPEGLVECIVCGELTDEGSWEDVGEWHGNENSGKFCRGWICAKCWSRWHMGSAPGFSSLAPFLQAPSGQLQVNPAVGFNESYNMNWKGTGGTGRLVSLGSWCGVKAALRGLALGGPTMPFDWIRISHSSLMHSLQTDFADFLDYEYLSENGATYVAKGHSFFHDVLDDPREHEKYQRRFRRFRDLRKPGISGCNRPLVFVRVPDTTVELTAAVSLWEILATFFDNTVYLLIILDCQNTDSMIFFEAHPRLLVCTISRSHVNPREYDIDRQPFMTAYHWPILSALWHAQCGWQPHNSVTLHSVWTLLKDTSGLLRHVSLGENLERYNYGIPQMPPDDVLRQVIEKCDMGKRELVKAVVRARVEWEESTGNPSQNSTLADEFLLWMETQPD